MESNRPRVVGRMFDRQPNGVYVDVMSGETLTSTQVDALGGRQSLLVLLDADH